MTAIALVLVYATCGSLGSPQDQYKARESGREDQLYPAAAQATATATASFPSQATDQTSRTSQLAAAEKQQSKRRHRRNSPWSGDVANLFGRYQPQTQQISRPYFIPVWYNGPNRIPVYLPPQPMLTNPGYPPHNKPGPQNAYLPPDPNGQDGKPDLGNRIEIYWDTVEAQPGDRFTTTSRPVNVNRPTRPTTSVDRVPGDGRIPEDNSLLSRPTTRRPPQNRPTRPNTPVDRVPGDGSVPSQLLGNDIPANSNSRPNVGLSSNNNNNNNNNVARPSSQLRPNQQRPNQRPTQRTTTWRPQTTEASNSGGGCVWAILSCCTPGSMDIPESCFINRGCPGPFWGNNPCDPIYTNDVLNSAMNRFE